MAAMTNEECQPPPVPMMEPSTPTEAERSYSRTLVRVGLAIGAGGAALMLWAVIRVVRTYATAPGDISVAAARITGGIADALWWMVGAVPLLLLGSGLFVGGMIRLRKANTAMRRA